MIEAEGVKIAENTEEAFWTNIKKESLKRIEQMRHEITISEAIIQLAEEQLKKQ